MKDFDIRKPDRVEKHQEAQDKKEVTYLGTLRLKRGLKVFGFYNDEIFEVSKVSKAFVDINGTGQIKSTAQVMPGTILVQALNMKNAIKKFNKLGKLKQIKK